MSEWKQSLPSYEITKGKVDVDGIDSETVLVHVQKTFASRGTINTVDGLKIDFPTSWVHLRKSNTEPIVRIIAEAPTRAEADALVKQFTNEILKTS